MLALELAVRLLLGLGLFQRDDLRLGQHQAFLGAFGFQRLEPLVRLHRCCTNMENRNGPAKDLASVVGAPSPTRPLSSARACRAAARSNSAPREGP